MKKGDTVTFKVDGQLLEILQSMPNRSEFIRSAILTSLKQTCPLCSGTGVLSPSQAKSWEKLSKTHKIGKCDNCNETHLVCKLVAEDKKACA